MSTAYGENGLTGTGYTPPKRVNFGWLGEAWGLYRENAFLWSFAILIGVYGPLIFDAFIAYAWHLTTHGVSQEFTHVNAGLRTGVGVLNIVYTTYIWAGIFRMAVKQVSGEPIAFSDIFSGARNFPSMLAFFIVAGVLIGIGSAIVLIPGILAAALLLPGFALVASGEPVGPSISRSIAAMSRDRFTGMGLVFGIGVIMMLSWLAIGLGPLLTYAMFPLVSALAYRDMIGLPNSGGVESIDAILGVNLGTAHAVSLTGEPVDDGAQK